MKIKQLGALHFSETSGLRCSISLRKRPVLSATILDYESLANADKLEVGDFVIHYDHGTALYEGVQNLEDHGQKSDFLRLRYADQLLYVPVERSGLVQKYYRGGNTPTLSRLGGYAWARQRVWTYRLEALAGAYQWPGLWAFPEVPGDYGLDRASHRGVATGTREQIERVKKRQAEWRTACMAYMEALHVDPQYRWKAAEFMEQQRQQPQGVLDTWWAYRGKIFGVESAEAGERDRDAERLLVKHYALSRDRRYEKIRREVEALENLPKLATVGREPIPEGVRLFVWQRDKGQCVRCGSRERLEFDHIIPVTAGGSSTERNVQLLCESCNRSKGSTV